MMSGVEAETGSSIAHGTASFMDSGVPPRADFFEESSGDEEGYYDNEEEGKEHEGDRGDEDDEEDWEDEDNTREFSVVEGLGLGLMRPVSADRSFGGEGGRGKGMKRDTQHDMLLQAMPPFNQMPAQNDSGTGMSGTSGDNHTQLDDGAINFDDDEEHRVGREERRGSQPTHARKVSLRRLQMGNEVRLVHNHGSGSAGQGTPRASGVYSGDNPEDGSAGNENYGKPLPVAPPPGDSNAAAEIATPVTAVRTRHRRNTSEIMNAVLQAHALTMRALESISPSASLSAAHGRRPSNAGGTVEANTPDHAIAQLGPFASWGFTTTRHIHIAPRATRSKGLAIDTSVADDPDRPAHLPSHFIKTPYPFTARKEFPKPRTRPRHAEAHAHAHEYHEFAHQGSPAGSRGSQQSSDQSKARQVVGIDPSAHEFVGAKGKRMLGLKRQSGSRTAEGVRRVQSERVGRVQGRDMAWTYNGGDDYHDHQRVAYEGQNGFEGGEAGQDTHESVVYVSLRHRRGDDGVSRRLERVVIPSSFTTSSSSSPDRTNPQTQTQQQRSRKKKDRGRGRGKNKDAGITSAHEPDTTTIRDFDDQYLAEQLHLAYHKLSGSWFRRAFSARKLKYIRLGRVNLYDPNSSSPPTTTSARIQTSTSTSAATPPQPQDS
jgi:hypothetical protein